MASPPRRTRGGSGAQPPFEPPQDGASPATGGAPQAGDGGGGGDTAEGFEPPPMDEDGHGAPSGQEEPEGMPSGAAGGAHRVDPDLLQMKQELEQRIFARPGPAEAAAAASSGPTGAGGGGGPPSEADIVGVGIGPAHRDFESVGPAGPGAPVLNVYVAEPMSMDQAKALLVDGYGARALSSDRRPVNVIRTGPIDAYAHRHRERPSPCGISVAHRAVTAGTAGALARGRSGERANRLLLLSNNHVLANSNAAAVNDPIVAPGPFDGGVDPRDRIAVLERWVTINFAAGGVNFVDCATAWCWPDRVRKEFIFRSGGAWAHFQVGAAPAAAAVGQAVGKSGRTTQLTSGRVIDVNASIRVNFGGGRVANFRDQVTIRGNNQLFSQGGDSGSLIWTWDTARRPVGLLFAGGGDFTFANKIHHVLNALDINLVA